MDKFRLTAEILKNIDNESICILLQLIYDILHNEEVPDNWYKTHLILLHKGGNNENPNNWRPIIILSIIYKVMTIIHSFIHTGRAQGWLDLNLGSANK